MVTEKIEVRTSKDVPIIQFTKPDRAESWIEKQIKNHGASAPKMHIVRVTTTIKEEIIYGSKD